MNKPQIITVNGSVVLGQIATSDSATVIADSMSLGQVSAVTKQHLTDYMCAANLGKLDKDITVTGQGAMFAVQDLDEDLALEFQILNLKFTQAQQQAVPKLVNQEFRNLVR